MLFASEKAVNYNLNKLRELGNDSDRLLYESVRMLAKSAMEWELREVRRQCNRVKAFHARFPGSCGYNKDIS